MKHAPSTSRGATLPEYPNRKIGRAYATWRFAAKNLQPLDPRSTIGTGGRPVTAAGRCPVTLAKALEGSCEAAVRMGSPRRTLGERCCGPLILERGDEVSRAETPGRRSAWTDLSESARRRLSCPHSRASAALGFRRGPFPPEEAETIQGGERPSQRRSRPRSESESGCSTEFEWNLGGGRATSAPQARCPLPGWPT